MLAANVGDSCGGDAGAQKRLMASWDAGGVGAGWQGSSYPDRCVRRTGGERRSVGYPGTTGSCTNWLLMPPVRAMAANLAGRAATIDGNRDQVADSGSIRARAVIQDWLQSDGGTAHLEES